MFPMKLHDLVSDLVGGCAKDEIYEAIDAQVEKGYCGWIAPGMLLRIIELE